MKTDKKIGSSSECWGIQQWTGAAELASAIITQKAFVVILLYKK